MEYQLIASSIPHIGEMRAVERVLTNRGIKYEDINHYLNTTEDDVLDPKLLDNLKDGARMLVSHLSKQDKIFIQVDSDCDGFTSAALLINYLHEVFPAYSQNIIYRIHDGKEHGLIPETIPDGVALVIAPDSSSNDYAQHEYLKTHRNIDVLVIDHHEADHVSEHACVINNQLCDYPTKSLCGVAMVYKFCCYIDELMNTDYAEQYRDLVALGLIADMMDMRDFETKHLIMSGLNDIRNPFFKTMVKKQEFSLKGEVTPIGIAFYVAPYVNATIRMGDLEEKTILFESMLHSKAYSQVPSTKRGAKGQMETLVEQACRNCTNIKNRQTKARDNALEEIEAIIAAKNLLDNKMLVVKLSPEQATDKNLTGLIANQLMSKYQRPVLLLNKRVSDVCGYESITWEGSGRNYDKSKFDDLRTFLQESQLVLYAEGHANAMGVGIADGTFDDFINYANTALADYDFTPCYKVDFIFQGHNFNPNEIIDIASLNSIWGQGVSEPFIAIENLKVSKDKIMLMSKDKNPTLKFVLPNGMSLIKFKSSEEEYEKFTSAECYTLNVVGKCAINVWNGNISAQLLIDDYEITGTSGYYF